MKYELFYTKFPAISITQTRSVTIFNNDGPVPPGRYGFLPMYCTDKKCDCRRALIRVERPDLQPNDAPLALLSYGWEPKSFYRKWSKSLTDDDLKWFKGPGIDPFQRQSVLAPELLSVFLGMLKEDAYAQRFIRQYVLYKWKIGMKLPKDLLPWLGMMRPCPCGSGILLKDCCAKK